jgi:hypothetical protein
MELFEPFMAHILKKQIYSLSNIEQKCKDVFNTALTNSLVFAPLDNLNHTINLHDICFDVYKKLLNAKIQICCLIFSDGNKIYIEKNKLCLITFFNNYFDDFLTDNNVVIEFIMGGVIDDYDMMVYMIDYVTDGDILINAYDYEIMYRLLKVDDYLLDVIYTKKYYYCGENHDKTTTLKNTLKTMIYQMITRVDNLCEYDFDYDDGCFDKIYELCQMTNLHPQIFMKPNGIFYKHNDDFINSKLVSYMTY